MLKVAVFVSATALGGCGETVMTCPRVATPVLLGPVDRIGGAARTTPIPDASLVASAEAMIQIAHAVGGTYTRTLRTPRWAGSRPVWLADIGRNDDIHVVSIYASGFVWDAFGVYWMDNAIDMRMAVTKGANR